MYYVVFYVLNVFNVFINFIPIKQILFNISIQLNTFCIPILKSNFCRIDISFLNLIWYSKNYLKMVELQHTHSKKILCGINSSFDMLVINLHKEDTYTLFILSNLQSW